MGKHKPNIWMSHRWPMLGPLPSRNPWGGVVSDDCAAESTGSTACGKMLLFGRVATKWKFRRVAGPQHRNTTPLLTPSTRLQPRSHTKRRPLDNSARATQVSGTASSTDASSSRSSRKRSCASWDPSDTTAMPSCVRGFARTTPCIFRSFATPRCTDAWVVGVSGVQFPRAPDRLRAPRRPNRPKICRNLFKEGGNSGTERKDTPSVRPTPPAFDKLVRKGGRKPQRGGGNPSYHHLWNSCPTLPLDQTPNRRPRSQMADSGSSRRTSNDCGDVRRNRCLERPKGLWAPMSTESGATGIVLFEAAMAHGGGWVVSSPESNMAGRDIDGEVNSGCNSRRAWLGHGQAMPLLQHELDLRIDPSLQ